jgi:hypothetical protein
VHAEGWEETGDAGVRVAAIDGHLLGLHDLFPGQVEAAPTPAKPVAAEPSKPPEPALEPPSDDAVPRAFVPEAIDIDLKGISSPVPVAHEVERSARIVAPMAHAVTLPGPPPSSPSAASPASAARPARHPIEQEVGMPVAAAGESDSGPTRRDSPVAVPKVMLDAEPTMLLPGGSSAAATVAALAAAGKVTTTIPVPAPEDASGEVGPDGKRGGRPRRR